MRVHLKKRAVPFYDLFFCESDSLTMNLKSQLNILSDCINQNTMPNGGIAYQNVWQKCEFSYSDAGLVKLNVLIIYLKKREETLPSLITRLDGKNLLLMMSVFIARFIERKINQPLQWSDKHAIFTHDVVASDITDDFICSLNIQANGHVFYPLWQIKQLLETSVTGSELSFDAINLNAKDKNQNTHTLKRSVYDFIHHVTVNPFVSATFFDNILEKIQFLQATNAQQELEVFGKKVAYTDYFMDVNFDFSKQSIAQLDTALAKLKTSLALSRNQYIEFIHDDAKVFLLYTLAHYIGTTASFLSHNTVTWLNYATGSAFIGHENAPFVYEYQHIAKINQHLFFPLYPVVSCLFDDNDVDCVSFIDHIIQHHQGSLQAHALTDLAKTADFKQFYQPESNQANEANQDSDIKSLAKNLAKHLTHILQFIKEQTSTFANEATFSSRLVEHINAHITKNTEDSHCKDSTFKNSTFKNVDTFASTMRVCQPFLSQLNSESTSQAHLKQQFLSQPQYGLQTKITLDLDKPIHICIFTPFSLKDSQLYIYDLATDSLNNQNLNDQANQTITSLMTYLYGYAFSLQTAQTSAKIQSSKNQSKDQTQENASFWQTHFYQDISIKALTPWYLESTLEETLEAQALVQKTDDGLDNNQTTEKIQALLHHLESTLDDKLETLNHKINQTFNKPAFEKQQTEHEIDLRELFISILTYWPLLLICLLLSLSAGIFYLHKAPPIYAVNAMLQIDDNHPMMGDALLGLSANQSSVETEIEILKSRMVLGKVGQDLQLDIAIQPKEKGFLSWQKHSYQLTHDKGVRLTNTNNDGFIEIKQIAMTPSLYNQPMTLTIVDKQTFGLTFVDGNISKQTFTGINNQPLKVKTNQGEITVHIQFEDIQDQFTLYQNSLLSMTDRLTQQLSASEKGKRTGILSLSFEGNHPNLITDTLNHILTIYTKQHLAQKSAEKAKTLRFLDKQLPDIKKQLEQSEYLFNQFRKDNNTVDVSTESKFLLEQSIELGVTLLSLEQKKAALSARFTDDYPLLKQITAQMAEVSKKINDNNERLKQLPRLQQEYLKRFRDVEINTQLYTNLLNNYQKLKIAKAGEVSNVRVIDHAIIPINPIKPRKTFVLLLFTLLGIVFSILIIMLINLLKRGIKNYESIEETTQLPVLANIPRSYTQRKLFKRLTTKPSLLFVENKQDMTIEALRSLRTAIHFSLLKAKNNVLVVTGPSPNIGKSFISANFAAVLAHSGKSVVLIDADMRRGHLNQYYGINKTTGLAEYLANDTYKLSDITSNTLIDNLTLISKGKHPDNPSELLMSVRFKKLVEQLSLTYDYVLIDTPPMLAVTDAAVISELAGSTLIVCRYDVTNLKEIEMTIDRLRFNDANILGIIFNDVQKQAGANSYQYGYEYGSK